MSLKSRQARRRRIKAARQMASASLEVTTFHEAVIDHLERYEYRSVIARSVMSAHGLKRGLLDALKADHAARAFARPAAAKTN